MLYRSLASASLLLGITSATGVAYSQPLTVTDQYDRSITLAGPAERIVTIPIPAAAMVVAIDGGTDRLAGMHHLSRSALMEGILGEFFPAAQDIPADFVGDGFSPNVEEVLQLDPDVVIQWGTRGDDIVQPLTDAGLDVLTLAYGTEDLTREWINIIGSLTDNDEKAGRLIDWRDEVMQTVSGDLADVGDEDRPRVVYFLRFHSSLRVAGDGTYNNFYIDLAGGQNPANGERGWLDVGPEQIIAWDPEVILLNGFESDLSPQDVYDNPLFGGVSAVRERRVYQVPLGGYRWDPPSQESPLMWMWLAEVLQPDQVDYPLRSAISDAYVWIYGQEPSPEQVDAVLRVEANSDASGYEVFLAGE